GTDRMDLGHVFGSGHQGGHGAKGISLEVHVQTGDHHPDAAVGQVVADRDDLVVEELGLVNADHITAIGQDADVGRSGDRGGPDLIGIVGNHHLLIVADVHQGFEDFHLLFGDLGPFQPSDEFFGLAREHGTADDLYPSKLFLWVDRVFEKHTVCGLVVVGLPQNRGAGGKATKKMKLSPDPKFNLL